MHRMQARKTILLLTVNLGKFTDFGNCAMNGTISEEGLGYPVLFYRPSGGVLNSVSSGCGAKVATLRMMDVQSTCNLIGL